MRGAPEGRPNAQKLYENNRYRDSLVPHSSYFNNKYPKEAAKEEAKNQSSSKRKRSLKLTSKRIYL